MHDDEFKPSTSQPQLSPMRQSKVNQEALDVLRHQLTALIFDAERIRNEVARRNQSRNPLRDKELDPEAEIARRVADYAAADWSELDRLAITRAAVWIAHADGLQTGVTIDEYRSLKTPRAAAEIPATARAITRRLSETVIAPDADALAVVRSDALIGVIPALGGH